VIDIRTVEAGAIEWAAEASALLSACKRLVEYYGTDEEFGLFCEAVRAPAWFVDILRDIASRGEVDIAKSPECARFLCTEELATVVTPLMQILVEYRPDFVEDAFEGLDEQSRRRFTLPYGEFLAVTGRYLCGPVWARYRHLAPPGWPVSVGE
jgi:hypothetical protein